MLTDTMEEQSHKREEQDKLILDLVAQMNRNQLESENRVLHNIHQLESNVQNFHKNLLN